MKSILIHKEKEVTFICKHLLHSTLSGIKSRRGEKIEEREREVEREERERKVEREERMEEDVERESK